MGVEDRPDWRRVAHQLSRTRKEVSDFARGKYALDDACRERFTDWLAGESPRRIAELVVIEAMDHSKCRVCKGRAKVEINNKEIGCRACKATGEIIRSDSVRREILGFTPKEWNIWKDTFRGMQGIVADIEVELFRTMRRR